MTAMWRRVVLEVWIPYPPSRVFPYFADPVRWMEFAPAVEFRQRIGDGTADVGSRWWAVDRILGPFKVRFADELLIIDPPHRVVWHSTSPWNSYVEYTCTEEGGGTRVLADYAGDVAGWLRLVALLPTFVLERILMRDFHGLTRVLAAEDLRWRSGASRSSRPDATRPRPAAAAAGREERTPASPLSAIARLGRRAPDALDRDRALQ